MMDHGSNAKGALASTNANAAPPRSQDVNLTAVDAAVIVLNCALHRLEKGKTDEAGQAIREAKAMLLSYQLETGT